MIARVAQLAEHPLCRWVVIGSTPVVGSTFKSRSYAGHRFMNTGHERDSYSVVTPARRALGSPSPAAAGVFNAGQGRPAR